MKYIAIIDYGSGNVHSALKSFERAASGAAEIVLATDPAALRNASHIVLPGVGAFADCKAGLMAVPGMVEALETEVLVKKKPFFGICVGMQLLATSGEEYGTHQGLGWVPGVVRKLEAGKQQAGNNLKIPHMGWNTLEAVHHPLLEGLAGKDVYFVHSYHFVPENSAHIAATVMYGQKVMAAIAHENIFGTQFHPEKSQASGLRLIENFINWQP